jgi:hypothetical protein
MGESQATKTASEKKNKKTNYIRIFLFLLPIIVPLSIVYTPSFWISLMVLVDFYTPWVAFDSPMYKSYHKFITDRLPEREEKPLIEIDASQANMETIIKLSQGFTWFVLQFICPVRFLHCYDL